MNSNNVVTNANTMLPTKESKPHDSKMSALMSLTLVLGLLTLLTFVSVLGYKKNSSANKEQVPNPSTTVVEEEKAEAIVEDDELGRKKLIDNIDELELNKIGDTYSEDVLMQDLKN